MIQVLAFDRASVRHIDTDGRLHVPVSNLTKASVDPYFGREIPGWRGLGLDPVKVYWLLRHPDELQAAVDAGGFDNLPILDEHVPFTVATYDPDMIIGSTGSDARFVDPFVTSSTVIWKPGAIGDIQSKTRYAWSCGYRYQVEMTSGVFNGLRFDGIMRNIVPNHLALVDKGRAGPEVIVGDSLGGSFMTKRIALLATASKIVELITPSMAQDAAPIDVNAVADILEADQPEPAPTPTPTPTPAPAPAPSPAPAPAPESVTPMALDAAIQKAKTDTVASMNAVREAERLVRPHIGEVSATVTEASEIYRMALDHAKVDLEGVDPSAFKALVQRLPDPNAKTPDPVPTLAMDRAGAKTFIERFPNAQPLKRG